MKNVSIRQQGTEYIVYFYDQRIITKVNEVGAYILDRFLNCDVSAREIAQEIAINYGIAEQTALKDVKQFLAEILNRMKTCWKKYRSLEKFKISWTQCRQN